MIVAMTNMFLLWWCRFGIRCNAVLPGFIETTMTAEIPRPVMDKVQCIYANHFVIYLQSGIIFVLLAGEAKHCIGKNGEARG